MLSFALVSKKIISFSSATFLPSSIETCLFSSKSHLFPIKTNKIFLGEKTLQSSIQFKTFLKESLLLMS